MDVEFKKQSFEIINTYNIIVSRNGCVLGHIDDFENAWSFTPADEVSLFAVDMRAIADKIDEVNKGANDGRD